MNTTYPVYISPDGQHEQAAGSPAVRVRLEHAGWRLKTEPRRKKTRGSDVTRPHTADS